ncbi:MAG TPA: STAS domain-containing protein [Pseudonocardiaceae bacterium]|nr:STAS domain-containing protein [Pseudonocardiaceae bacterium]
MLVAATIWPRLSSGRLDGVEGNASGAIPLMEQDAGSPLDGGSVSGPGRGGYRAPGAVNRVCLWREDFMSAEGAPKPGDTPKGTVGLPPFQVTVTQLAQAVPVVHVAGELDMLTGPLLEEHLHNQLAALPARLIVDLSGVSFLGSSGLAVLVSIRDTAERQGTRLQLSGTSRRTVANPLKVTGLDHVFEILPVIQ